MRLNLYLRGIDLIDVEFHVGSRGLYLDLNVFKPRDEAAEPRGEAPLEASGGGNFERVEGPVWADDQPAVVRRFGFHA